MTVGPVVGTPQKHPCSQGSLLPSLRSSLSLRRAGGRDPWERGCLQNGPYGKRLKGLSTLGTRKPVPGYRHKMVLCSRFEYPICDCVHNYRIYSINRPERLLIFGP